MDDDARRWWHGPPLALPRALDRVARDWARIGPRARAVAAAAGAIVLLVALTVGARGGAPGPARAVLVVRGAAPAGALLADVATTVVERPRALVPDDALRPGAAVPDDARTAVGLLGGEVLRTAHVDTVALVERLLPDEVAVVVTLPPPVPRRGEVVDLVGTGPGGAVGAAAPARVLAVDADGTWFAVARSAAPAVVDAAERGALRVAWLPPPRPP